MHFCNKDFQIGGTGVIQVDWHARSDGHEAKIPGNSQSILCSTSSGQLSTSVENEVELSRAMQGLHAETKETLHKGEYNQIFASATNEEGRFWLMFPNHPVSEDYHFSSTKCLYLLCYGIAEVLFEEIKNDIIDVPCTVRLDESTTSQVKKLVDIYVCYWSKIYDQVVTAFEGFYFIGHCTADLLKHIQEYFLVHVGMDGPNANLKFEKELEAALKSVHDMRILRLGTCSLHPVHSAFKKWVEKLNFPFAAFFNDSHLFFKLPSTRSKDYKIFAK